MDYEKKHKEEEEIKKAMIDFFKSERKEGDTVLHYGVNIESMIAWIEKQKPIDWDEYDEMYVSALIAIVGKDGVTGTNLRDTLTGWLSCLKGRFKKD
jgi:site-specific recombinase XerC